MPQNRSLTQSIVIGRKLGLAKEFLCRNIATRPWICGNDRQMSFHTAFSETISRALFCSLGEIRSGFGQ
jgi:hypothetical protein